MEHITVEETAQYIPMPLINTSFPVGKAMEYIEKIENADMRRLALAEYYHFSGKADKAAEITDELITHDNISIRVSACWISAYSNLSLGHIHQTRFAMEEIKMTMASLNESTSPLDRASAAFVSIASCVLLHLPIPDGLPPLEKILNLLPIGLRYYGMYVLAHHIYLQEDYSKSLGIVEAALAMQEQIYPISNIYLHLIATMDCMSLKQPEKAKEHLMAAWELSRPDDLITGLAQHHGLLGGMLEAALKKDYPEDFKRIINITYQFSSGWRKVHNPDTGHDVADNLTTTEFAIAMLAARDWSNKEIAAHLGLSANTVKDVVSKVLQKLNISQRKELRQYMLK